MSDFLSQIATWITNAIESLGYVGIVLFIALENIFPPIPSELILPFTGFLVSQNKLWFPGVLLASTTGSLLGALFLYYLSSKLGRKRVDNLVSKHGKWVGVEENDMKKAVAWFDKHGKKTVFMGRLAPTIRSVVSIPAGLINMDIKTFILYTALGSALWNGTLISIGWLLGDKWKSVQQYTKFLEYGVFLLIAGFIYWIIWKKRFAPGAKK